MPRESKYILACLINMDDKEKLKKLDSWILIAVAILLLGSGLLALNPPVWLGITIIVFGGILIIPLVIILIKYISLERKIKKSIQEDNKDNKL